MQHARRVHFESVICHGSFCYSLFSHQPLSQERSRGQVLLFLFTPPLNDATCSQLDAIPTVGFSDPILSYISALQFHFDGVRMLKEGYEKVICSNHPSSYRSDDSPTFRQDQVYSKSPTFGDGRCWLPDLSSLKISGRLQMMFCL